MALKNLMMFKNLTKQDLVHHRQTWLTLSLFPNEKNIWMCKIMFSRKLGSFWKPYFLLEKAILVCHDLYTIYLSLRQLQKGQHNTELPVSNPYL